MILERDDAIWAATKLMTYFKDFNRIDDYFRARKIERVKNIPASLPGMGLEDDMFQSYDMHPQDMNFSIETIPNKTWDTMLEMVASFSPDDSPGKNTKLVVKETTTNTIVGFIRLGSPLINSKPRNDYLGDVPDLHIFNQRAIQGHVIVPVQNFGYNFLGVKLLALIISSHTVRRMLNEKYDTELALWETSSLYGNIKGASAYDQLKPYLRYWGDTESKFLLTLGEDIYFELRDWFTEKNGGEDLIHKGASSRKMKIQVKILGVVKASLKKHDTKAYELFTTAMDKAGGITTNKRYYGSTWGFANTKEVLLGKTDKLIKSENFDRYELESVISFWRKMASKRYDKLVAEDRVAKSLEIWTRESMNDIRIIR